MGEDALTHRGECRLSIGTSTLLESDAGGAKASWIARARQQGLQSAGVFVSRPRVPAIRRDGSLARRGSVDPARGGRFIWRTPFSPAYRSASARVKLAVRSSRTRKRRRVVGASSSTGVALPYRYAIAGCWRALRPGPRRFTPRIEQWRPDGVLINRPSSPEYCGGRRLEGNDEVESSAAKAPVLLSGWSPASGGTARGATEVSRSVAYLGSDLINQVPALRLNSD